MPAELNQALDYAIDMEIKIRDFYLESKEKVESSLARDILQFLAEQEIIHIENIRAFQQQLAGERPPFDLATRIIEVTKTKAKKFFSNHRQQFETNITASPDDAKIYETGLAIEKNGYEYYKQQAEQTDDPQAKQLFTYLMQEEQTHYELLEKMSAYFLNPGLWFIEEEGWMFDGA